MKISRFTSFALVIFGLLSTAHADSILLTDNFNGSSVDLTKWQVLLPPTGSSVTENGGVLTTTNRGTIASVDQFTSPYVISGSFTMLTGLEHFNIAFRTDLSTDGIDPFYERRGLFVSFSNDGDEISIQRYNSSLDWDILADTHFSLMTGQAYTFSVLDTGSFVKLAVNGIDLLSATTTYSTGSNIALSSREFGSGTAIDSVTVTKVPDGGAPIVMLGLALAGLVGLRRKLTWAMSDTSPTQSRLVETVD